MKYKGLHWQSQAIVNFVKDPKTFNEVLNTFSFTFVTKSLVKDRIERLVKENRIEYVDGKLVQSKD